MFLIMSSFTSSFTSRKMFLRMLDFDPTHLRDKDQVGNENHFSTVLWEILPYYHRGRLNKHRHGGNVLSHHSFSLLGPFSINNSNSALKTKHIQYFWKAWDSRISNMTFTCVMKVNNGPLNSILSNAPPFNWSPNSGEFDEVHRRSLLLQLAL